MIHNNSSGLGVTDTPLGDGAGGESNGSEPLGDADVNTLQMLKLPVFMMVVLSFAYLVVFVLSIVNNSLVVSVIYRNPQLRTVTNYFIANLAVADILVSIMVLPLTLLASLFEGQ